VAEILASGVFNAALSLEMVELAALKFLLVTGCRRCTTTATAVQSSSLLRGSYLLQSIRTLYHVYLTTKSSSNKVAARAAQQQLVTSVFTTVTQQGHWLMRIRVVRIPVTVSWRRWFQVPVRSESVQSTGSYHVLPSPLIQL
jgi:hypothetical protein